jgi:hypothetical protein
MELEIDALRVINFSLFLDEEAIGVKICAGINFEVRSVSLSNHHLVQLLNPLNQASIC